MILADVNILVYAYKEGAKNHEAYRDWLASVVAGDEAFAVADHILSSFIRIVTNPKIFAPPSTLNEALEFVERLREHPNAIVVAPGPRHWGIFLRFCRESVATGNVVPDAYLAALAVEAGCEWITTDRGFNRFGGLRWRHALQPAQLGG